MDGGEWFFEPWAEMGLQPVPVHFWRRTSNQKMGAQQTNINGTAHNVSNIFMSLAHTSCIFLKKGENVLIVF